jgi:hypothetical protein
MTFFVTKFIFYSEGLLAPCPTPKLEDLTLSFVHGCLLNLLAATHLQNCDSYAGCGRNNSPIWEANENQTKQDIFFLNLEQYT